MSKNWFGKLIKKLLKRILRKFLKWEHYIPIFLFLFLVAGYQETTALAKEDQPVHEIIDLTGILQDEYPSHIVQGNYATRAEFARILVQASEHKGSVAHMNRLHLFSDVSKKSRAASYIQMAVTNSYMSGYLNGKFYPNKAITYKEAVYSILSLLGYTNEDFTGQLAGARYTKFNELNLSKNLNLQPKDKLKESHCELLIYNLLHAKQKNGEPYGESLGYAFDSNHRIDYQLLLNSKTKGPILTKKGWTEILSKGMDEYTIMKGTSKISPAAIQDNWIAYYTEQTKTIWIYEEKIFGSVENITYSDGEPVDITVSGTTYMIEKPSTMKNISKNIKKGSLVVLSFGRENKVSFLLPIKSTLALGNLHLTLSFPLSNATIYKNGSIITADHIKLYDVVYYSEELKTLWVYDDKAYGVLKSIRPNNAMPDSVVVANKSYSFDLPPVNSNSIVEHDASQLSSNLWGKHLQARNLKEGDHVIVLLGYHGYVVDIVPMEKMQVTLTGYVLKLENQVVKSNDQASNVKPVLQMVDTQGIIREFPCEDSTIKPGMVVEVSFLHGKPILRTLSNAFNPIPTDITSKKLSADAKILQVKDKNYTVLNLTQLKELSWKASNILHYQYNSLGEITELILNLPPMAAYQYFVVKDYNIVTNYDQSTGFQYDFLLGDIQTTMITDSSKWSSTLLPKAVLIDNNQIQEIHDLTEVTISYINNLQANTGSTVYWIDDNVTVYFYKNGHYHDLSLADLKNFTYHSIKGYLDTQGPIRIIIVHIL